MKTITGLLVLILSFSLSSFGAGLEGVESPAAAAKSFFSALKEGPKSINKAMDNITGINSESTKYSEDKKEGEGFDAQLKKIMVDQRQGKVVDYKMTSEITKIQGSMIKQEYTVTFAGGMKKTIELIFYRPTINGKFHLFETKFGY